MLTFSCGRSVRTVMSNHFFKIGGQVYRQRDGSPIGLDLSAETACIYMTLWDTKLRRKLKSLGLDISLYCRLVDNILIIMRGIALGWSFD